MTDPQSGEERCEALVPLTEERIREIIREEVWRILREMGEREFAEAKRYNKFLSDMGWFTW